MRNERAPRYRKRLLVRWTTASGALPRSACTLDVSAEGVCLNTGAVLAPGTHVLGRIDLPRGGFAEIHGVVAWARRTPAALASMARGGMGLKLVWADSRYFELVGGRAG